MNAAKQNYRIRETGPANARRFEVQYEELGEWYGSWLAPSFDSIEGARKWLEDLTTVNPPDTIHNYP